MSRYINLPAAKLCKEKVEDRKDSRSQQTHWPETLLSEAFRKGDSDSRSMSAVQQPWPEPSRTPSFSTDLTFSASSQTLAFPYQTGACSPPRGTPPDTPSGSETWPDSPRSRFQTDQ